MKKLLLAALLSISFISVLITACRKNFLEILPTGAYNEQVLSSKQGLERLLIGTYSLLDGFAPEHASAEIPWGSAGGNWIYGDAASGDAHLESGAGDENTLYSFERHLADYPQDVYLESKFTSVYDGISRTNDVLRVLALSRANKKVSEDFALQVEAEARFLRAYYHLEAIKMWDFIPYVTEKDIYGLVPNQPASSVGAGDASKPWSELERDGDIPWEKAEADFQFAINHLPETPRNGEAGRATKYAALGLMSRTLLYQGKFGEAHTLLNEIINSDRYSLTKQYEENFRASGDNNPESIFQIQASVNDGSPDGANGNYGEVMNFPSYLPGDPTVIPAPGGGCCGFHLPTQDLVNAFKTKNGLPYLQALGLEYDADGDDVINDMDLSSGDPFVPDPRPLDPRLDWTVGRRGIPYLDWGNHPGRSWIKDQHYGGPYSPKKMVYYKWEQGINTFTGGWTPGLTAINYSILRYADILLMAAECEVETGSLDLARDLVNQVRARAANPAGWVYKADSITPAANYVISVYPAGGPTDPFQSQTGAREAVRFERRLELGMEGWRFWDLKRWGLLKPVLEKYAVNEGKFLKVLWYIIKIEDREVRYPIPAYAIQSTHNAIRQNPGY